MVVPQIPQKNAIPRVLTTARTNEKAFAFNCTAVSTDPER